ncbi:MAG TPA: preprotein translocase subunit YajC [Planctomycetaceae bacterium]|nr:preprotein translocase subunit YajC [Planctomycetaceae bacterium]
MDCSSIISLLADVDKAAPAQQGQPDLRAMMLPMLIIVAVWYFLILRPQGKERRMREALLSNLKKNDRVVTHSGIIGTVVSFSNDNKEVTLRVDDTVKLKFLRSAIQGPLAEPAEEPAKPAT